MKVIGKGSGGVVQLVRHKWLGKLYALKVSIFKRQFLHEYISFNHKRHVKISSGCIIYGRRSIHVYFLHPIFDGLVCSRKLD